MSQWIRKTWIHRDFLNKNIEKLSWIINKDFEMNILEEKMINKVLKTLQGEYESLVDSLQVHMDIEVGVSTKNLK